METVFSVYLAASQSDRAVFFVCLQLTSGKKKHVLEFDLNKVLLELSNSGWNCYHVHFTQRLASCVDMLILLLSSLFRATPQTPSR